MKKIQLSIFFLSLNIISFASNKVDSVLNVLDVTIKERFAYSQKKELRIDSLKIQLNYASDYERKYEIYQDLFGEYRNYNMDSALWIAEEKLVISQKMKKQKYIYSSKMNIAEIMSVTGMYKEALDIMAQIDRKQLDERQESYYLHVYHSIYTLMSENSFSKREKVFYQNLVSQYKDSSLMIKNPTSLSYRLINNNKLLQEGQLEKALETMLECYNEYNHSNSQIAIIAYGLSEIYNKKGDKEKEKLYLAISAAADLRMGVKEYIALQKLAILLYQEGDIDRAYRYIKCAMEDAAFCKARFRTLKISETLPIISAAYDKKIQHEKDNLFKAVILISVLSFILTISLFYIYKQLKKLSIARKSMKEMNTELKQMNDNLNELNKKLSESNLVKEEYIGSVFNLCSTYIDKLENYRININRKLKARKLDEAFKITNSSSLVTDELKELYRNFDVIFLNIYPNFIDEFNALLLKEEQITPKAGDILTPELRVFALVRLGISDSSKIANFLHYSPQTVYNYKLKVRNKLAISKDEFSVSIQQIGK